MTQTDYHKPHIEIIGRAVITAPRRTMLLCVGPGYTYLPGGHVESGERAADAVYRELLEETGEAVRVGNLLSTVECHFVQQGRPRHELNLVFHVELTVHTPLEGIQSREPQISFRVAAADDLVELDFRPVGLRPHLAAYLNGTPLPRFLSF